MTPSSPLDRDVSFWLNVVMLDAVVTSAMGLAQAWPWYGFVLIFGALFPPALAVFQFVWYYLLRDDGGTSDEPD